MNMEEWTDFSYLYIPPKMGKTLARFEFYNKGEDKMKTYICIGYPDEENAYHGHHTKREEWKVKANSWEEAFKKACKHFYYFHEIGVWEEE